MVLQRCRPAPVSLMTSSTPAECTLQSCTCYSDAAALPAAAVIIAERLRCNTIIVRLHDKRACCVWCLRRSSRLSTGLVTGASACYFNRSCAVGACALVQLCARLSKGVNDIDVAREQFVLCQPPKKKRIDLQSIRFSFEWNQLTIFFTCSCPS